MTGPWLLLLLVLSIGFIVFATGRLGMHPFLVLLLVAIATGVLAGLPLNPQTRAGITAPGVLQVVSAGFGDTLKSIGIEIVLGTIMAVILDKTGAALVLARTMLRLVGKRRAPLAINLAGFMVSIPVFSDSGFVILAPLNRALAKSSGVPLALMGTALCFGLYSTHIFVPPTPGPIAAAGALGADLGTVIGIGLVVAIPACLAGLLWALWAGRRFAAKKPLPAEYEDVIAEPDHLPRALSSFLPLVVPILLIALRSVSTTIELPTQLVTLRNGLGFLGQPALALLIGVFLAMRLAPRGNRDVFGSWIRHAMGESATTLAVTGAGGAFGAVLAATGMAQYLGTALAQYRVGLLLPFLIAAAIKTAQGSSTVAQATGAAIVVPMLGALGLVAPMGRVLAVMAVSAGAMVVLHANGSYFWVITQLTDMDVREGYLLVTLGTLVVGVVSFLTILALSLILL